MDERKGNYAISVLFFFLVILLAAIQQQSGVIRVDQRSSHCIHGRQFAFVRLENLQLLCSEKIYETVLLLRYTVNIIFELTHC